MKQELRPLTGIRFIAAFYVFIFHAHLHAHLNVPWRVEALVLQGPLGVNLFFLLSGFLLTYRHASDFPDGQLRGWLYYRGFLFKRFSRIYPVYFLGLLSSLLLGVVVAAKQNMLVVLLNAVLLQSYVWPLAMQWYGSMAWSVSVEVFFYLLLPVLLPLLLRLPKRDVWACLGACWILGTLPGLYYHLNQHSIPFSLQYSFPLVRLPEFVAGCSTALLVFRFRWRVPAWLALGSVAGFIAWLSVMGPRLAGYVVHNMVAIPVLVLLLAALSQPQRTPLLRWLGSSVMVYLGRISYSFYIIQWAVMVLLEVYLQQHRGQPSYLLVGGAFAVNLLLAALVYELIEKRAHTKLLRLAL
jgi:peptidoglycan/LPS O-acetylase OafA/YrhL